jgi:glucose-6-phosphate 1-epimerase
MTHASADLDRRHGIPGLARVVDGNGGLPKVTVTTPAATGEIYLHGGHVTSWTPAGHADVLFVSPRSRWEAGRAIRGGIPVCFPWFGNKADDRQAPAHGFVRTTTWMLESIRQTDNGVDVSLAIESDGRSLALWPHAFRLVLRATFGAALRVELAAANTGETPLTFEEALHTYHAIGDATAVRIAGLDGVSYLDKVDGGRERVQEGAVTIAAETDRVYFNTAGAIDIDDLALRRRLHISKAYSRSTIVWNPWVEKARALADLQDDDWRRMVCVETANVRPDDVELRPGEQHVMSLTVTVS